MDRNDFWNFKLPSLNWYYSSWRWVLLNSQSISDVIILACLRRRQFYPVKPQWLYMVVCRTFADGEGRIAFDWAFKTTVDWGMYIKVKTRKISRTSRSYSRSVVKQETKRLRIIIMAGESWMDDWLWFPSSSNHFTRVWCSEDLQLVFDILISASRLNASSTECEEGMLLRCNNVCYAQVGRKSSCIDFQLRWRTSVMLLLSESYMNVDNSSIRCCVSMRRCISDEHHINN